ncbi:hypothetical protein B4113_0626 [Geobacillus sp. B4113_201601]|nr:hypothetical protein B4113_0626 [Geobacillus sp. B4113_201601]
MVKNVPALLHLAIAVSELGQLSWKGCLTFAKQRRDVFHHDGKAAELFLQGKNDIARRQIVAGFGQLGKPLKLPLHLRQTGVKRIGRRPKRITIGEQVFFRLAMERAQLFDFHAALLFAANQFVDFMDDPVHLPLEAAQIVLNLFEQPGGPPVAVSIQQLLRIKQLFLHIGQLDRHDVVPLLAPPFKQLLRLPGHVQLFDFRQLVRHRPVHQADFPFLQTVDFPVHSLPLPLVIYDRPHAEEQNNPGYFHPLMPPCIQPTHIRQTSRKQEDYIFFNVFMIPC